MKNPISKFVVCAAFAMLRLRGMSETNMKQTSRNIPSLLGQHCLLALLTTVILLHGGVFAPAADMSLIPAGSFTMGDTFSEGNTDERPTHSVYVSAFYMDSYLVTKDLWDTVKSWNEGNGYGYENGGLGKASSHPVVNVNWFDVVKWCNARSQNEGLTPCYYTDSELTTVYKTGQVSPYVKWTANGYRLPTEAEWEKAARGGASGHRFPWSDADTITHSRANYNAALYFDYDLSYPAGYHPAFATGGFPYTSPVGYFAANGYGLYDMAGNVWEWCWDWYDSAYYSSSPGTDPRGPASGSEPQRVLRGGNWFNGAYHARCAVRSLGFPSQAYEQYAYVGFRCVRNDSGFGCTEVYTQDFSSDPGWSTSVPGQMYWDASGGRYHVEIGPGGGQYAYVTLPTLTTNASFKLEFDLTMVREDYAGGISVGLSGSAFSFSTPSVPAVWVNYGRGDGGNAATVGFKSDTVPFGFFPGAYDVLTSLNTTYHNQIIYDKDTHSLQWIVTSGGTTSGPFVAAGVGTFTGLERLLVQNDNTSGTVAGYLDNISVCQAIEDFDADGVTDKQDQCPNTPSGEIVNTNGCSISQLVPCAGPLSGGAWQNHGQYVSSVAKKAEEFLAAGLITQSQKDAIVAAAARSDCGREAKTQAGGANGKLKSKFAGVPPQR